MQLTEELLSIGLSNNESEVYIATLQLGYATVQEIADKAQINRTTAYTYIKNLIARGLLNAVEKNGRINYLAERPEKLTFIYEQQEREMKRKRELLDRIMPELESIYMLAKDKPSVRFYEHDKNLDVLRQEIVNARFDEVYTIFNHQEFGEQTNRRHVQNVIDSVQSFKALYVARNKVIDPRIRPFQENEKFRLRYLPVEKFNFKCELLIGENRVYIAREQDSLLINDKLFAQTLTLLFHALWGMAEEV